MTGHCRWGGELSIGWQEQDLSGEYRPRAGLVSVDKGPTVFVRDLTPPGPVTEVPFGDAPR
jgi:hypothetical protein